MKAATEAAIQVLALRQEFSRLTHLIYQHNYAIQQIAGEAPYDADHLLEDERKDQIHERLDAIEAALWRKTEAILQQPKR